jgi:hypothetical protein
MIEHQRLVPAARLLSPPGVAAVSADLEPDPSRAIAFGVAV